MSWFILVYLMLVILVPVGLSVAISVRTLPEGRSCPLCRGETLRLLARWLAVPSYLLRRGVLQRRWCPECGWEGICRLDGADPTEVNPGAVERGRGAEAGDEPMDVRHLHLDGEDWRVLLQCWTEGGRWFGRLLFRSPTGRCWADPTQCFSGRAPEDVLAQALALPEHTLECRLRDVVSD